MPKPKTTRVYLVSPDPTKIEGLEHGWSNLHIICGGESAYLRQLTEITFLGLSELKSTAELLAQPAVKQLIPPESAILVFKHTPRIEKLAAQQKWQVLMPPSRYLNMLEDKINFVEFCTQHKLPQLPTQIGELSELEVRLPAVVQRRRGHGGSSTRFVRTEGELAELRAEWDSYPVKIAALLALPTYSSNICVLDETTHQTQPFRQLTDAQGSSGGIDLTAAHAELTPALRKQIAALGEQVGQALRTEGYRGVAGLDYLVDNETSQIWLLECNARLLRNLGYLTRLEAAAGETTLLERHLRHYLGLAEESDQSTVSGVVEGRADY